MKSLKSQGLEELKKFRSRICRVYGKGRVTTDVFSRLLSGTDSLIKIVNECEEQEDTGFDEFDDDGSDINLLEGNHGKETTSRRGRKTGRTRG